MPPENLQGVVTPFRQTADEDSPDAPHKSGSPSVLWAQALSAHPDDPKARREAYRHLCEEAGFFVSRGES